MSSPRISCRYCILCILTLTITQPIFAVTLSHTIQSQDSLGGTIALTLTPEPSELIISHSLMVSSTHPALVLGATVPQQPAQSIYDPLSKQNIEAYDKPILLTIPYTIDVTIPHPDIDATAAIQVMTTSEKAPVSYLITIPIPRMHEPSDQTSTVPARQTETPELKKPQPQADHAQVYGLRAHLRKALSSATHRGATLVKAAKKTASELVKTTQSLPLRLLFVFLLGLLMSLTPCIYPMIPITLGILQASAQKSFFRNFALALAYTAGIATTFATLGLIAAYGGAQFGSLLGNPWFVLVLVLFFAYLSFSMLGWYELRIPSFLQPKAINVRGGSFISAFIFGAISGSVASPCVSPGLLLLLGMVAALKNTALGFVYLFLFGCGLGTPLLIIGTFSNSIKLAPRAGSWMLEIKKIFGLMLLGMCFYYATPFIAPYVLYVIAAALLLFLGLWFVFSIKEEHASGLTWYHWIMGTLLMFASFSSMFYAFKAWKTGVTQAHIDLTHGAPLREASLWHHDYAQGLKIAREHNRLLLLKFGASWCSSCVALERRFNEEKILQRLPNLIPVSIDCTRTTEQPAADLQKKFAIQAFPTLLIVDPVTETIIDRPGAEVIELKTDELIAYFTRVAK